jgi:ABC-type nickel/cobalt efflux system permease component RcnA
MRIPHLSALVVGFAAVALLAGAAFAQAPQNPFSLGGLEGAGGRPQSGVAGYILCKQAEFTRAMTAAARAVNTDASALWTLVGIAFAYGVFHAAGPGHGKAIVASYVVANESALKRGVMVATAAAIVQGVVAVALVGVVAILIGGTRRTLTAGVNWIELASYAAIAAFGLWLLARKARALWRAIADKPDEACDHVHLPGPDTLARAGLKEGAAAALAAGIRPCSGAILILVFTLAQGAFWAGALAVAAMAVGVAFTTSAIAAAAVYAKGLALGLASGRGRTGEIAMRLVEVLAALAVTLLGLALVSGQWANVGGA